VADSEELQARIGDEIGVDSLIALGAEHGCDFSADDLTAGDELSDEELDGVADGVRSADSDSVALDQLLLAANQGTMNLSSATTASTEVSIAQAVTDFTQGIARNAADHVKKHRRVPGEPGQG
jgi:hypothetical protein